jgi:hypothetical protein
MYDKFKKFTNKWLKEHSLTQDCIDEWLLGENLECYNIKTTCIKESMTKKTPYHAYYRYKSIVASNSSASNSTPIINSNGGNGNGNGNGSSSNGLNKTKNQKNGNSNGNGNGNGNGNSNANSSANEANKKINNNNAGGNANNLAITISETIKEPPIEGSLIQASNNS